MEERELKNNYIFALVKLFLFLLIFCFLTETIRSFLREAAVTKGLTPLALIYSWLATFSFYLFFADLNSFYARIQKFFFRSQFFSCLFPSLLVIFSLGYFLMPNIFNFSINRNVFIFSGSFSFLAHLIYVARIIKANSFTGFVNYLFIFSIFFLLNLILFGLYLRIAFDFQLSRVLLAGIQNGSDLIKNIFLRSF